jgi:hypothetical protein
MSEELEIMAAKSAIHLGVPADVRKFVVEQHDAIEFEDYDAEEL